MIEWTEPQDTPTTHNAHLETKCVPELQEEKNIITAQVQNVIFSIVIVGGKKIIESCLSFGSQNGVQFGKRGEKKANVIDKQFFGGGWGERKEAKIELNGSPHCSSVVGLRGSHHQLWLLMSTHASRVPIGTARANGEEDETASNLISAGCCYC